MAARSGALSSRFPSSGSSRDQACDAKQIQTSDFAVVARTCVDRSLPTLFAVLTNLRAALYAIQAFSAIDFQTHSDSVISLDLTGIIAFDAVREWEAARRLRCGVPVVGRNGSCIHAREKDSGFA
ncbi:hypothetical protein LJR234_003685 [Mesorhizobium amorphae]|uniref:hypothetical protein n=1 Tax=Mesorhizobium amorphae TaxID=71433 RepID=UPI003ECFBD99